MSINDPNLLTFWVGIILLFSAGSFLYVATIHILPEVFGDAHGSPDESNEDAHYSKVVELTGMVAGMMLPFLLLLVMDDD